MTLETVLIPTTIDGDYGVAADVVLSVTAEITPADEAPRDRYGRAEYPDSPAQVEIVSVVLHVGAGLMVLTTFDHQSIEQAVQEELAAQRERETEAAI